MRIVTKDLDEANNLVFYVLVQGDMRYFDNFHLKLVANFIFDKAIDVEKEVFSFEEIKYDEQNIQGPQKIEKFKALKIIESKNFKFIGFEMPFLDYKADILAEKDDKNIVVECGPCKPWKPIDYLEEGADLWVLRDGEQTELFILTKGENWDKKLNEFRSKRAEELKKIPSPLDTLMNEKDKEQKQEENKQQGEK